jgi:hypothetical protein
VGLRNRASRPDVISRDFSVCNLGLLHLSLTAEDVGVTGIEDSHGGAAEELTASSAELDLNRGEKDVSATVRLSGSPYLENPIAEQLHSPKWTVPTSSLSSGAGWQLRRLK